MKNDPKYLERIIDYCTKIKEDCEMFGDDEETYLENSTYQRSTNMCLLQIGETVNKLSAELLKKYNKIEWDAIIGFRNVVAHKYEWMDHSRTWITISERVPELKEYCKAILYDIQNKRNKMF